jgi:hypothetical protein
LRFSGIAEALQRVSLGFDFRHHLIELHSDRVIFRFRVALRECAQLRGSLAQAPNSILCRERCGSHLALPNRQRPRSPKA